MNNQLQKTLKSNSKSNLKEEEQKLLLKNNLKRKILDSRLKKDRKVSRLRYYLTSFKL